MPYLAFNLNNGNEFVFDLVEERLSLGRNARNEIVIENTFISNFHAELLRQTDGNYQVIDLKSSGGIFVNDQRINSAVLKPDDKIRFGPLQARYAGGEPSGPCRVEKGAAVPAADKSRQDGEREDHPTETVVADARETTKVTTPPETPVETLVPPPVIQPKTPPVVTLRTAMPDPDSDLIPPITSKQIGGLVRKLGIQSVPPAEPEVPGLALSSLIAKPELAAAMDAGLDEERARTEEAREAAMAESTASESCDAGPTEVDETNLAAISTVSVAVGERESTAGEACIKVLHAEMVQLERAKAEVAAMKRDVEKSKRDLESVQQRLAEHKFTEQNTRERLDKASHDTQEYLVNFGYNLQQVEGKLAVTNEDSKRSTAHMGRFMTVLILANLLALAGAIFWIDQILPSEIELRLPAYKSDRVAQSGDSSPSQAAPTVVPLPGNDTPVEIRPAIASVIAPVVAPVTAPAAPTTPLLGEDLPPTQRELVILKERNRLTAYADEAIATGLRAPYERLWDSLDDPQLANLVHAARAEILRVQAAYLNGTRIDRFDIPVASYFPQDSGLTDGQLKDGQLIKLLREAANPWEVRMKAANLLGTRHSKEVGDALVQAVKSDANLDVVKEATFSFEQMTGYHSKIFDAVSLEQWWNQNKAEPRPPEPKTAGAPAKTVGADASRAAGPLTSH